MGTREKEKKKKMSINKGATKTMADGQFGVVFGKNGHDAGCNQKKGTRFTRSKPTEKGGQYFIMTTIRSYQRRRKLIVQHRNSDAFLIEIQRMCVSRMSTAHSKVRRPLQYTQ